MPIYRMPVTITSPVLGGTGVNLWHLRATAGGPGDAVELNLLSDMVHSFYQNINEIFHGSTTIAFDGEITEVGTSDPEVIGSLDSWSVVGGTTTPNLPPANCLVASWGTSSATRSGRGRTFLGPISRDAAEDNGTPVEAARTSIVDAGNTLIEASEEDANGAIVIWSVKQSLGRDVTSVKVANKFAVLRSRRD